MSALNPTTLRPVEDQSELVKKSSYLVKHSHERNEERRAALLEKMARFEKKIGQAIDGKKEVVDQELALQQKQIDHLAEVREQKLVEHCQLKEASEVKEQKNKEEHKEKIAREIEAVHEQQKQELELLKERQKAEIDALIHSKQH